MPISTDARVAEVWDRLASVTDPELDESVTELRFVTAVEVDAESRVHIGFRLPTYWCSPNFAFLMADDMRAAAGSLPWVRQVLIDLRDHMYSDTINQGLAQGHSFKATFAEEAAEEDLDDLRRTFRIKAYQRRQEAVIRHLMERGWTPPAILALDCPHLATITPETFSDYLTLLRRVRINTEFNGSLCRGLLQARYGDDEPASAPDGEPTLADFIAGRVDARNERGNHSCRK